jgi:hypothetical protein
LASFVTIVDNGRSIVGLLFSLEPFIVDASPSIVEAKRQYSQHKKVRGKLPTIHAAIVSVEQWEEKHTVADTIEAI